MWIPNAVKLNQAKLQTLLEVSVKILSVILHRIPPEQQISQWTLYVRLTLQNYIVYVTTELFNLKPSTNST